MSFTIPVQRVIGATEALRRRGMDPAEVLERAAIAPELVRRRRARVTAEQLETVLATLLFAAPERVRTRDELTDAVWPDGPAPASNALDVAVGTLAQLSLQQSKIPEAIELFARSAAVARTEPELANAITYEQASRAQLQFIRDYPEQGAALTQMASSLV